MAGRSTGFLASRFLERRVPLRGKITKQLASCCIARLLVLATEDRHKPLVTYIDSPGGSAAESLGIISTMNGIRSPVVTFCRGPIGGAAAVIAAHGLKGFRTADPGAHFSLRLQSEPARDGHPETRESYLKLLSQILAQDTGNPEALVLRWLTDGAEFTPQEAIRNGLIDAVAREPLLPKQLPVPDSPKPPGLT
jgi:ATP-dependent Clp endopeptidase proteolytic subunit ClpP